MTDTIDVETTESEVVFDVDKMEIEPIVASAIVEGDEYKFPILWTAADQLHKELRSMGVVDGMITTEFTVQDDKKLRAKINKGKNSFEDSRKSWQRSETKKHKDFLSQAQDTVLTVYDDYSAIINKAIQEYEAEQKQLVEDNGRAYWDELSKEIDLQFVKFEDLNVKIGVNTSDTQLSKLIDEAADPFTRDLKLIALQPEPDRVMEKYVDTLDLTEALLQVADETRIYEEMKRKEAEKKEAEPTLETVEDIVDTVVKAPVQVEKEEATPSIEIELGLKGNKELINWILNMAEENGLEVINPREIKNNRFF